MFHITQWYFVIHLAWVLVQQMGPLPSDTAPIMKAIVDHVKQECQHAPVVFSRHDVVSGQCRPQQNVEQYRESIEGLCRRMGFPTGVVNRALERLSWHTTPIVHVHYNIAASCAFAAYEYHCMHNKRLVCRSRCATCATIFESLFVPYQHVCGGSVDHQLQDVQVRG